MTNESNPKFSRATRMEAMRELASAISFDLTDLVTVIQHTLRETQKNLDARTTAKEVFRSLEKAESTLEKMGKLAKGLRSLGLSGDSEGFQTAQLKDLISKVLDLCHPWFEKQGVRFETGDIPDVALFCRPAQVSQAVINLINNALDATGPLTEKWVKLSFSLEGAAPPRIQIAVIDSGKISEEAKARMLEPFFSTKPPGKGIGLGLNIAKSIAESHSGKLYLDAGAPNTRMVFEIPAQLARNGKA